MLKKKKRLIKNCESAQLSRQRKRIRLETLQAGFKLQSVNFGEVPSPSRQMARRGGKGRAIAIHYCDLRKKPRAEVLRRQGSTSMTKKKTNSMARAKQLANEEATKKFHQATAAVMAGLNSTDLTGLQKKLETKQQLDQEAFENIPLPDGFLEEVAAEPDKCWQQHEDSDGRIYWWNSQTTQTRWAKPRILMTSGEKRNHEIPEGFLAALAIASKKLENTDGSNHVERNAAAEEEGEDNEVTDESKLLHDLNASAKLSRKKRTAREFGIIVYGCSGMIGRKVIIELAAIATTAEINWAVAGRSRERMSTALQETGLKEVDIFVADAEDIDSLLNVCKKTAVLINCISHLATHGEAVVQACLETQTAYIDLSEDPEFFLAMHSSYHAKAVEREVLFVHGCGFHSLPADEGVFFSEEHMGACAKIESFLAIDEEKIREMEKVHFEEAYSGMLEEWEGKKIIPEIGPELISSDFFYQDRDPVKSWATRVRVPDIVMVKWSSLYRAEKLNIPQIRYATFSCRMGSLISIVSKEIQEFFSSDSSKSNVHGNKRQGPPTAEVAKKKFQYTFFATGYENEDISGDPNLEVVTRVSGPDPQIVTTSICAVASAVVLLLERQTLHAGGVLTPSVAFAGSSLRPRLSQRGIKFEVLGSYKISTVKR